MNAYGILAFIFWRLHCPHSRLTAIWGEEIIRVGGWRLRCMDCGRYLNGPASLAASRANEGMEVD